MISPTLTNAFVSLERPVITIDELAGSKREVWTIVDNCENVPASIQPVSALVRHEYAARQIIITHRIYTRKNLNPKRGDRIRPSKSESYYVVSGFFNVAGRNEVFVIEAREVTV
jgi:hypothetical protein